MGRTRKRPTYYEASCLRDGTVLSAMPTRKPATRILKRDKKRIDLDNIIESWRTSGVELRTADERRFRFFDIITNSLNNRRNIRDLVLPALEGISRQMAELQASISRIEERLGR